MRDNIATFKKSLLNFFFAALVGIVGKWLTFIESANNYLSVSNWRLFCGALAT
jgi:hypothetical protein